MVQVKAFSASGAVCVCHFFVFTHIYVEASALRMENTRSGLLRSHTAAITPLRLSTLKALMVG